jgi:iron complex outermembrane recepter protein
MKTTPLARRQARTMLQATPVAAACAALLCAAGGVHAQDTAAGAQPAPTVITVTGIRRGIESAINVKKNSDSIVESISSEDIGKLPDSSIAESISRLPGLTAQRVGGRATEINIRGLSGDFANTLLNGREQVSTGNNRSVEFDQFPSELISGVDIYKTPSAALVGQGLSGTIDLKTLRPLSFGQRTFSFNVRGEKNGGGTPFEGSGNRVSATYVDQFADRTIGVVLGVARLTTKTEKSRKETYDDSSRTSFPNVNGGAEFTFNQGFKYFVDANEETRTGTMGAIEFKPNKDLSSMVDFFYSKFDKEFTKRGIELQVNDSWKGGDLAYQSPTLTNAVITDGRLISGVWGNVNPLSRTIWEPREDDLKSIGWNTKWKFADATSATFDISSSKAKSVERIVEMEAGVFDTVNNRPLPGTVTVGNYGDVTAFQYNHGDPAIVRLTDPESWGQNGYDKVITTDDKMRAVRLQLEHDLGGFVSRVSGGLNLNKRDKTKGSAENFLRLPGRTNDNPGGLLPEGTTTLGLPGSPSGTVSFDPAAAFPGSYRLDPNVNGDILNKGWTVNEDVKTLFLKGDLDSEVMGMALRGNIGLQYVRTDQSSTAPQVDNTNQSQFTLRTSGKSYTDVLPSVNLVLEMPSDQFLRMGLGKQMARPRMDQLRAFTRSEVNDQLLWTGSGGNPQLDPFRATALDVSYEKYFGGNKGYVSAAAFYKDLKSYIFEVKNSNFDFTGFPNLSPRTPLSNIGEFTAPRNGEGGTIRGFELAASVPLNMLTPVLDGFGVVVSYSKTSSAIKPFGTDDVRPLPGLSPTVTQLTAYYEKYGFSARVGSRKRAAFLAEIEDFGADRGFRYARGETIVDLQLGYEFQSGMAKGLGLLLQVNNANNEPYVEYNNTTGSDTKLDEYGRTILFGVSYKF